MISKNRDTVHTANPLDLPVAAGWTYLVRLHRPPLVILDGTWTFPTLQHGSTS